MSLLMTRFSIRFKFLVMLLCVASPAVALVSWLGYSSGKQALTELTFNQLTSIRATKSYQIQHYFQSIRYQVQTLSEDLMIIEAMREFKSAFHELETAPAGAVEEGAQSEALHRYYSGEFIPALDSHTHHSNPVHLYMPSQQTTLYLQHHYIANNPHPRGKKDNLMAAEDGSRYSQVHSRYHPILKNFQNKFGYYDLFLVDDSTGHIVYSVFKETDFATSLLSGPYRRTNIAEAFDGARAAQERSQTILVDFEPYGPSYGAPASFMASPIFDGDKRVGVLVFQMPINEINRVMTGDYNWQRDGLGKSGETYLVGSDYKMRSTSRFIVEDREGYLKALRDINYPPEIIERIAAFNTSILLQDVRTHAAIVALSGKTHTAIIKDYRGIPVLSAYAPLEIEGMKWAILSEMDESEALAPVRKLANRVILTTVLIGLAILGLAVVLGRLFTKPIHALAAGARQVARGNHNVQVEVLSKDELGELAVTFNSMVRSIREKSETILNQNKKNEELLLNILPSPIADRLKGGEGQIADAFGSVSVLFADLVGFTRMSSGVPPAAILGVLNQLFTGFNEVALQHNVEKIKTIGDAYMAVCGLPNPVENHAESIADVALGMMATLRAYNQLHGTELSIRIGLNCGPVVAGVIGSSKFIYDLWGDTVNIASRMESHGLPDEIQVTEAFYEMVREKFELEPRGEIEVKGAGSVRTYLLKGRRTEE
ncbi:MAG: adenylate/guanylate cyclase domain-containing protein [Planctomycetota bacterium]